MQDKEILDLSIGGRTIREMTAIDFLHYLAKKIDGLSAYSATNQELVSAVSHPPMGNNMPEEEKVRLVRKLLSINVQIP